MGSPAAATSVHCFTGVELLSNFYRNQAFAPTLNQQVLVQNDTGPAAAAEAETRHSTIMNERTEQFREFARLQHEAISSASRFRFEFLQAENRLQHQEEAVKAAGESMANKHCEDVIPGRIGGLARLCIMQNEN